MESIEGVFVPLRETQFSYILHLVISSDSRNSIGYMIKQELSITITLVRNVYSFPRREIEFSTCC